MTTEIEITPEKGDIVRNLKSGVEYVFYGVSEKKLEGGETLKYSTWLMEMPNGRLSEPFVVLGGFDVMEFIERGAPREPGEKPVRSMVRDAHPEQSTMKAPPGRL